MDLFSKDENQETLWDVFTEKGSLRKEMNLIYFIDILDSGGPIDNAPYVSELAEEAEIAHQTVRDKAEHFEDEDVLERFSEGTSKHTYYRLTEKGERLASIISKLKEDRSEKLREFIEGFKTKFLRFPTKSEVKDFTGIETNTNEIRELGFDYTSPDEDMKERKKELLSDVIRVAMAIHRDNTSSNVWIESGDKGLRDKGDKYAEENEELLEEFERKKTRAESHNGNDVPVVEFYPPQEIQPFLKFSKFILNTTIQPKGRNEEVVD